MSTFSPLDHVKVKCLISINQYTFYIDVSHLWLLCEMTTKNCANGPKLVLKDLCEKSLVRNDRLPYVIKFWCDHPSLLLPGQARSYCFSFVHHFLIYFVKPWSLLTDFPSACNWEQTSQSPASKDRVHFLVIASYWVK